MAPCNAQNPTEAARPSPIRFVLLNAAIGAVLGCLLAAALVYSNPALQALIAGSASPAVPIAMLLVGFASLVGGLYAGAAIMLMPYRD